MSCLSHSNRGILWRPQVTGTIPAPLGQDAAPSDSWPLLFPGMTWAQTPTSEGHTGQARPNSKLNSFSTKHLVLANQSALLSDFRPRWASREDPGTWCYLPPATDTSTDNCRSYLEHEQMWNCLVLCLLNTWHPMNVP